jgi:DNA polymerase III subunit gamma/tau
MFYLKYRPKTLEEVDNVQVRESIAHILKSKHVPHAFLFAGQKGTGKTSVARIVARTLNKLKESDSMADIVEMDAASNRGIDEVRNIIREASYLPMSGVYRIFIIDEAHMITTDAYNALLKTLEEPPSTAVFILATTNIEKVPKTIISRCSVINFGRAQKADIISMLKRIAKREDLKVEQDLLELVAQYADFSFRDAAKILEDLAIQKKLTLQEAKGYLGLFGTKNLVEVMSTSNLSQSLAWTQRFVHEGGSVKTLLESALSDLHTLLLERNGVKTTDPVLATTLKATDITSLIKLFSEAYRTLQYSPIESLPLEIAIAEFYNNRHV